MVFTRRNRRSCFLDPLGGDMLVNGKGSRLAVMALATVALTACGKKDSDNAVDTSAASSTAMGPDTSAATPAAGAWTDANIVALLDEANMADSANGSVASTKGTASAVRDYGKMMMRDHHTLRAQGAALAKKLNVTPQAPSDDPLMPAAQADMNTLNSTAKGKDFDKAYIDGEVAIHKAVLATATKAANQTQNTELKNLIQKAAPLIQAHLTKAESIQKTLK
jgi:putative membrane protein